jgi:formylglycine-generating enzyme required for sulfatase activity
MVEIPAGTFRMGCDRDCTAHLATGHVVRLSTFFIDRYEVTIGEFAMCQKAGICGRTRDPYDIEHNFWGPLVPTLPVAGVTWDDADRYCHWIGRRLPTEAEWEKAARGTDARKYPWGNAPPTCELAQVSGVAGALCRLEIAPVGLHPRGASPYGVLDLAGNVPEWTSDWFHPESYRMRPFEDPQGWPEDFQGFGHVCRGTARLEELAVYESSILSDEAGFRCARSASGAGHRP